MSSSEQDTLSHFAALDELIQLIYQGAHKFVVISSVGQLSWDVHLGLTGPDGRWWKGKWTEKDIQQFVGNAASSFVIESFAEKLAQTLVQGDLQVGDWNPEKGTRINLTLGPTAKNPIRVPLTELTAQEAASYATRVFSEIAMQAQPRKCRMNPSDDMPSIISTSTIRRTSPIATSSKHRIDPESPPKPVKRTSLGRTVTLTETQANEKIKDLESKLALEKKKSGVNIVQNSTQGLASQAKKPRLPRPPKGASLANPNKKARKYQAIEFESDDDE